MDSAEKFGALRDCVRWEGDGAGSWFTPTQKKELHEFLEEIEERWDMFEEGNE